MFLLFIPSVYEHYLAHRLAMSVRHTEAYPDGAPLWEGPNKPRMFPGIWKYGTATSGIYPPVDVYSMPWKSVVVSWKLAPVIVVYERVFCRYGFEMIWVVYLKHDEHLN